MLDLRAGGVLRHAMDGRLRARALRDDCLAWFPPPARLLVPLLDRLARRWLRRSAAPYAEEITAIAATLGFSGVFLLNAAYQCSCTARATAEDGVPWLVRTLDWPFAGLGRRVEVAHLRGPAGDYLSATWPGYAGVLTAMAPGRFAAALNQAPLRRRTRHPWLRLYDLAAEGVHTWRRVRHMPPDQLLRQVFEHCDSFAAARQHLATVPVARPVIFILVGCGEGECCIIERTEEDAIVHDAARCAANDWLDRRAGWEARIGGGLLLTCSSEEAAENSRARRRHLQQWGGSLTGASFGWVAPPVLNPYTRLAVEMCPAAGILRVQGWELTKGAALPQPATRACVIAGLVRA